MIMGRLNGLLFGLLRTYLLWLHYGYPLGFTRELVTLLWLFSWVYQRTCYTVMVILLGLPENLLHCYGYSLGFTRELVTLLWLFSGVYQGTCYTYTVMVILWGLPGNLLHCYGYSLGFTKELVTLITTITLLLL